MRLCEKTLYRYPENMSGFLPLKTFTFYKCPVALSNQFKRYLTDQIFSIWSIIRSFYRVTTLSGTFLTSN